MKNIVNTLLRAGLIVLILFCLNACSNDIDKGIVSKGWRIEASCISGGANSEYTLTSIGYFTRGGSLSEGETDIDEITVKNGDNLNVSISVNTYYHDNPSASLKVFDENDNELISLYVDSSVTHQSKSITVE